MTTRFKGIDDLDVTGKRVLVRADLNVPMKDGQVTDDTRIRAIVPTIEALLQKGGRVIVLSHFDRPKGKVVPEMSLKPLAAPLAAALGQPVAFAADSIGPVAETAAAALKNGDVLLLENVRFHAGEEQNDPAFAAALAKSGDVFVSDAFSCAHRAHASTEGLAHLLPSAAGVTMKAELVALEGALGKPVRPVVAVVGGAKVSSKLDVLTHLVEKVDHLIIGGGMANTFLAAQGIKVGKSLCEHDLADTARDILARAKAANCTVHLPTDVVVAKEFKAGAAARVVAVGDVADDDMILDVGPASVAALGDVLKSAKTLIWNGPMGAFEIEPFDKGTVALAQAAAKLSRAGSLLTVAGGGDTVAALNHAGAAQDFSHISTAGGAFLEWMEGKDLPGVTVLEQ
ncbi:phosphoglycerate kinase [Govanella unica]|uniref:Phosphoglycerate kinase n=1 Tax=Govanella unica TaxID=2975056 RepID=A0A9X3Z8E2_9PROT|nr:phosphoglycerate kinase [Govania unica]MDA5194899.1 phosphoglycerate kinase [Govania unica]